MSEFDEVKSYEATIITSGFVQKQDVGTKLRMIPMDNLEGSLVKKEDYKKLLWMIPQRLVYRQLMYYIVIKSFNTAIKGELQGWGVLNRTGNVKQVVPA